MTTDSRAAFIARRTEVLDRVRRVLVEQLHIHRAPDEIDPDCPLFATGLGLDSVDAVELIVALESEFLVVAAPSAVDRRALRTVNTLVDYVLAHAEAATAPIAATTGPSPARAAPTVHGDLEHWPVPPTPGTRALRTAVAVSSLDHVARLRVSGSDAFALVDRALAGDLYLRDAHLVATLLLDDAGRPLADVLVGRDDEEYLLLVEGMTGDALVAHLRSVAPAGASVFVEDLGATTEGLSLDGPYAWELMAELVGPEVIGLPYANLFRVGDWLCVRSGKTGEYGYQLLVPRAELPSLRARIADVGRAFSVAEATLADVDRAMLESWFFNVRREGRSGASPIELQQQWRTSSRKDYVGAAALAAERRAGARRRVVMLAGAWPLTVGEEVRLDGRAVGTLLNAEQSPARGDWLALALVDAAVAHVGLDGFTAGPGGSSLRTVAPPVLANRSLFVNPQRHAFRTRALDSFPPVAGGAPSTDAA